MAGRAHLYLARVACAELDKDPRKASELTPDHRRWAAADRARAGVAGAYVATGHSVWGILNAPATGEAMAELILDGVAHKVDLRPFDPSRLPSVEPEAIGATAANLHSSQIVRSHRRRDPLDSCARVPAQARNLTLLAPVTR